MIVGCPQEVKNNLEVRVGRTPAGAQALARVSAVASLDALGWHYAGIAFGWQIYRETVADECLARDLGPDFASLCSTPFSSTEPKNERPLSMETTTDSPAASTDVIVHASFAPDGTCLVIGEQPAWATPQRWFDHLSRNTENCFRPLQGGRGTFTLSRAKLEELKIQP